MTKIKNSSVSLYKETRTNQCKEVVNDRFILVRKHILKPIIIKYHKTVVIIGGCVIQDVFGIVFESQISGPG